MCGWLNSKGRDIDVKVAADDPVVDVVSIDIEGDLDAIRERLAIGVGRRIPLIVADQVEALAGLQVLKLVRTAGDNRVPVLGASVLVLGDRHRVGLLGEIVESCERRLVWKTIVYLSGVSIAESVLVFGDLYGPL